MSLIVLKLDNKAVVCTICSPRLSKRNSYLPLYIFPTACFNTNTPSSDMQHWSNQVECGDESARIQIALVQEFDARVSETRKLG